METLSDWAKPEIIWFVVGLVLLLIEFAAPGLVIFFFGVGAWVVSAICFFSDISLNVQLGIFIITSILLLVVLRNRLKSLFSGFTDSKKDMNSNIQEFIGETAIVVSPIKGKLKGRVELHGTNWDASSVDDIAEGTSVEIIGKDSITLIVKKIEGG